MLNGSYLVSSEFKNKQPEIKVEECYAFCDGNELKDNHLFPMEMLLANEEINYWSGEYWYKENNWVFNESGSRVNVPKQPNPFRFFGSVSKGQAEKIVCDLSDQTGVASKFRKMISFRMPAKTFDELAKKVENEIEQSRNGDINISILSEYQVMSDKNTNNESNLLDLRSRMHRRGVHKKKKNEIACAGVVATLGILGIAALINPFDDDNDNTFFLQLSFDDDQHCGKCCVKCCVMCARCCSTCARCAKCAKCCANFATICDDMACWDDCDACDGCESSNPGGCYIL